MLKGLNSDVMVLGTTYHIQTEDWGRGNPYLVSRVYLNGAVVKSVKTPYTDLPAEQGRIDTKALLDALRNQHEKILDLVVSGQI